MQIEARIDQNTEISQKITLWSQSGSRVIRGNTLVIPIENSILYVEPLYLEAVEKGTLPELKRVIVAYGDNLVMRETLEEAGVLLAAGKDLQAVESHLIRRIREGSGDGSSGFQQEVRKADLRLRISLLTPWAHWITPRVNSRRFDTRFFHCHIPEGQHCIPDFVEAVDGLWISPAQALEGNRTGRIPLSPPTLVTLFELHQCGGAEGLARRLRNGSWGEPRRPKIRFSEGRVLILLPWDPCYGEEGDDSDPIPQGRLVSLDEPFSRLVHREGLWHPACP